MRLLHRTPHSAQGVACGATVTHSAVLVRLHSPVCLPVMPLACNRDLKPGNVLVFEHASGEIDTAHIIDWGGGCILPEGVDEVPAR